MAAWIDVETLVGVWLAVGVGVVGVYALAASGRKVLEGREAARQLRAWPRCGHSACRQRWIETGEGGCFREEGSCT